MFWIPEVNHFLQSVSEENGKTASPHTSRAYGYHLVDWLSYAEEVGLDWKLASHRQLAMYRNALARDNSILTKRPLKRETVNLRLGMICTFYKFMVAISTSPSCRLNSRTFEWDIRATRTKWPI